MNQLSFNSPELSKYQLTVDAYEIAKDDQNAFPETITCFCLITGFSDPLNSEYEERVVKFERLAQFVSNAYDYESIEQYMRNESEDSICDDLSCIINMAEYRDNVYSLHNVPFPESILK